MAQVGRKYQLEYAKDFFLYVMGGGGGGGGKCVPH